MTTLLSTVDESISSIPFFFSLQSKKNSHGGLSTFNSVLSLLPAALHHRLLLLSIKTFLMATYNWYVSRTLQHNKIIIDVAALKEEGRGRIDE